QVEFRKMLVKIIEQPPDPLLQQRMSQPVDWQYRICRRGCRSRWRLNAHTFPYEKTIRRSSYTPRVEPAGSQVSYSRGARGLPFYRQEAASFFEEKTVLTWLMVTTIMSWRTLPQAPDAVNVTQRPQAQLMTPALSLPEPAPAVVLAAQ